MKIISIINQKGGVGKSTTALSLGAGLSVKGYNVLFIDLDAQGNLTYALGAKSNGPTVFDLLTSDLKVKDVMLSYGKYYLISSSSSLAIADNVITQTGKEYRLKEKLNNMDVKFDYVIIDTPPALGILTVNALTASYGALVPAQADIFSLQGISQLYDTLQAVKKYCNPSLKVMGILLTRYNNRSIISRDVAEMIQDAAKNLDTKLYSTKIRENTAIKESQARKQNIFEYAPKCNASIDYNNLLEEILKEELLYANKEKL